MGGVKLFAAQKQKKHIGPIDPHALKVPARRVEPRFGKIQLIVALNQHTCPSVLFR